MYERIVMKDLLKKKYAHERKQFTDKLEILIAGYLDETENYGTILADVEKAAIKVTDFHALYNQTTASLLLGINRGTYRTRLKKYGIK